MPDYHASLLRLIDFYATLSPAAVRDLSAHYQANAWFKDPFNEVSGLAAIEAIFQRMYLQVAEPRFVIRDHVLQGAQAFITWDFEFGLLKKPQYKLSIHGSSHLRFGEDGRVIYHRDYWDVAEELYEKLPLLGGLMRFLKRRAHA